MIPIKKPRQAPRLLRERGPAEASALDPGDLHFKSSIYADPAVRAALDRAQHGKCCYCESKIMHVGGDVEHFRPKSSVRQSAAQGPKQALRPGYYWLVYEWRNLFLACAQCNTAKSDVFPLFPLPDGKNRARAPGDPLGKERPVLVDPKNDPSTAVIFEGATAVPRDGRERGRQIIRLLKLNRPALEERRREHLALLRDLKNIANGAAWFAATPENAAMLARVRALLARAVADEAEFAAAARALLG